MGLRIRQPVREEIAARRALAARDRAIPSGLGIAFGARLAQSESLSSDQERQGAACGDSVAKAASPAGAIRRMNSMAFNHQALMEALPQPWCVLDAHGVPLRTGQRWHERFGVVGPAEAIAPEYRSELLRRWHQGAAGTAWHLEARWHKGPAQFGWAPPEASSLSRRTAEAGLSRTLRMSALSAAPTSARHCWSSASISACV